MIKKGDEKFLSILIIIAIFIAILATSFNFMSFNELKKYQEYFTGNAVTSAKVNITISSEINYTLTTYNMSFGTGKVVSGMTHATLNSTRAANNYNTTILTGANWTNTTEYYPDSLAFRNDGSVNLNLSFTSSASSATFLGGTVPKFEYNASNLELDSCNSGIASFTEVASTIIPYVLCTNLSATDTKDTMYMDVRLQVPYDAVGYKLANLTFSANQV